MRPIDNESYMIDHLRCPLAMKSQGRTVLMENLEISTSLSGIVRHFEGYELQQNAATIINSVSSSPLLTLHSPRKALFSAEENKLLCQAALTSDFSYNNQRSAWHPNNRKEV